MWIARIVLSVVCLATAAAAQQPWASLSDVGQGTSGTFGVPRLAAQAPLVAGEPAAGLKLVDGLPGAFALIVVGTDLAPVELPKYAATLWPDTLLQAGTTLDGAGASPDLLGPSWLPPADLLGTTLAVQGLVLDPRAQGGVAFTSALSAVVGNGSAAAAFFDTPQTVLGSRPTAFALGDLDHDGRADAAIGQLDDTVAIALADPTGRLQIVDTLPTQGLGIRDVELVDLDGDGALDLLAACESSATDNGRLSVRFGDGAGGFGPPQLWSTGPECVGLATSDLDLDGDLDVVTLRRKWVSARLGDGTGGLGPALLSGLPILPATVSAGLDAELTDLTVDGIPDLVTQLLEGDGPVWIAGLGDGHFDDIVTNLGGSHAFTLADVNGDGLTDVIAGVQGYEEYPDPIPLVRVRLGQPGGGLGPAIVSEFVLEIEPAPTVSHHGTLDLVALPAGADGHVDLALRVQRQVDLTISSEQDLLLILDGDGTGGFHLAASRKVSMEQLAFADLDADGELDFVATDPDGWLLRTARGPIAESTDPRPVLTGVEDEFELADLDADGRADLVFERMLGDDRALVLLRGDGAGGFDETTILPLPALSPSWARHLILLTDVDADGQLDVIATPTSDSAPISVFVNRGRFAFEPPRHVDLQLDPQEFGSVLRVLPGRIDGDARLDLLVTGYPFGHVALRGDGGGDFQAGPAFTLSPPQRAEALGDMDADGDLDIVSGSVGRFWWFANDGTGQFGAGVDVIAPASGTGFVLLGPLDKQPGDDVAFVTSAIQDGPQVDVASAQGGGAFSFGDASLATPPLADAWLVDMNGDGRLDVAGLGAGAPSLALGLGDGSFAVTQTFGLAEIDAVRFADLDGDDDLDVLTRTADGALFVELSGDG